MVARAAVVSRDFLVLELRIVSGAAGQHPLSSGGQEQNGIRAYPEWQRSGRRPHLGGDCGELPASRWQRGDSRSSALVYGDGPADPQEDIASFTGTIARCKGGE